MGLGYFSAATAFLIETVFDVYIFLVMLRFLLQWQGADFYNPGSQFLVRVSNPLLQPLEHLVGRYKTINCAALLLLVGLQFIQISVLALLAGGAVVVLGFLVYAIAELLRLALYVFLFAILIRALLAWLNPHHYHSLTELLYVLSDPLLALSRRFINPINGVDLSPLVAIIGLQLAIILVIAPITDFARHLM